MSPRSTSIGTRAVRSVNWPRRWVWTARPSGSVLLDGAEDRSSGVLGCPSRMVSRKPWTAEVKPREHAARGAFHLERAAQNACVDGYGDPVGHVGFLEWFVRA